MNKWVVIGLISSVVVIGAVAYSATKEDKPSDEKEPVEQVEEREVYGPPVPPELEQTESTINDTLISSVDTTGEPIPEGIEIRNNLAYDMTTEEQVKEQYGEAAFNEIQQKAEKAMNLWVLNSVDKEQWLAVTTEQFYQDTVLKYNAVYEDTVSRQLTATDWVVSEFNNSDEIKFAFNISFDVMAHGQVVNKQQKLVYVTLKKGDNAWVVTKIQMSA